MWITEFTNYKLFLRALLKTFPKAGRGQGRRLADHLNVAPIVVSQILTNDRHLSLEQAVKTAAFFGLDDKTREYFIYLVHWSRADSRELKNFYAEKLLSLKQKSENVKSLVQGREELTDLEKATFYSNWYYCAVMILSSIDGYQTVEAIADYFKLSRGVVGQIVAFLIETGLCVQDGAKIKVGKQSIHVDSKSRFVNNHRRNWREKGMEKFSEPRENDLFFSGPVSISRTDGEKVRRELLNLIKSFSDTVASSPQEEFMCLNIDWFKV